MVRVLAVLLVLLTGCGAARPEPATPEPAPAAQGTETLEVKPLPGYLAADFKGTDVLTGEAFALADLKGQPVFLNFWATWCPPCQEEMPAMEAFHQELGDEVRVVAVSGDSFDTREKMAAFAESLGLTFSVVHDGGSAAQSYQVVGFPTSFFIDADGVIRVRHAGLLSLDQMKEYAQQASNTAEK